MIRTEATPVAMSVEAGRDVRKDLATWNYVRTLTQNPPRKWNRFVANDKLSSDTIALDI